MKRRFNNLIKFAALLKIISYILNFLSTVIISRELGKTGYGEYTFILSLTSLGTILTINGMHLYTVREISTNKDKESKAKLILTSIQIATILSFSIALFYVLWLTINEKINNEHGDNNLFILCLFLLIATSINQLREAALIGIKKFNSSQILDNAVTPTIILVGVIYLSTASTLSTLASLEIYTTSSIITCTIGLILLIKNFEIKVIDIKFIRPISYIEIFKNSSPFFLLAAMQIASSNIDAAILNLVSNSSELGVYKIGYTFAALIPFLQTVSSNIIAPKIKEYFDKNQINKIIEIAQASQRECFRFGIFLYIVFCAFGMYFIPKIYGNEFEKSYIIIIIIGAGQVFNVYSGPLNIVFSMMNKEKQLIPIMIQGLLYMSALTAILSYFYGAIGAAISTSFYIIYTNAQMKSLMKKIATCT